MLAYFDEFVNTCYTMSALIRFTEIGILYYLSLKFNPLKPILVCANTCKSFNFKKVPSVAYGGRRQISSVHQVHRNYARSALHQKKETLLTDESGKGQFLFIY